MTTGNKQGKFLGIPYDWRRPTLARFKSRLWNRQAAFITPRAVGWGYDLNFYAVFHPLKWRNNRSGQ
ncbi:MAG: DUF5808 domain-containing protein [Candidatus Saccharimonadales bacterium]